MLQRVLRRGVSACALILAIAPLAAQAQQSLPTIEIGARTHASGHSTGKPHTSAGGGSSGPTRTAAGNGSGDGSGSGSYWQQLDEKKKIPEKSYVAPYASSGTKTDTPIMDTPLNVQVVTPQQLKDRQVTTVAEAVKYVSGVTVVPNAGNGNRGRTGRFGDISIRGFQSSTSFRNGFRNDFAGIGGQDFANVASVEVLKGSAATLYGLVEPGGIINIITNQPQEKPAYSAQQQVGNYGQYRTTVGATGPVTSDKSVLYRIDAAYENNHSFIDLVKDRRIFVAPVVRWNISQDTQVNAELQYSKGANGVAYALIPAYNGYLFNSPRSRNYGADAAFQGENFLFGLNWKHNFDSHWQIKQQLQYIIDQSRLDNFQTIQFAGNNDLFGAPPDAPLAWRLGPISNRYDNRLFSTATDLIGHFSTGELEHTFLTGVDYYMFNSWGKEIYCGCWSGVDIFHPVNPGLFFVPGDVVSNGASVNSSYNFGAYIHDQIKLPFGLHLMGGARYQNTTQIARSFDALDASIAPAWDPTLRKQRVTPRIGVLWRPRDWISFYSNYTEGFGPQYGRIYPNDVAPPSDARQFEAGVKTEFFDGRMRATAAYFNLSKTNVLTTDLQHPGYQIITGEVNAKGAEFDVQGEIVPGWNVTLAYANTEARITKDDDKSRIGERFFSIPRNTASFFTTYALQDGWAKGLSFGGGVTYNDAQRLNDFSGSKLHVDISPYTLVSLMSSYSFDVGPMKMTAQLNVDNLLDHKYYSDGFIDALPSMKEGWSLEYRSFGPPRMIRGALSVSF